MKTNGYSIIMFLVSIVMISCNRERSEYSELIDIKFNELKQVDTNDGFSAIIDSVEFIPLETNDSCLLGDLKKVVVTDTVIYVLAEVNNGVECELHQFSKDGSHLRRIGRKGEGPGELSSLNTFDVYGDTVIMFDEDRSKVSCYDSRGNYLNMISGFIDPTGVTDICAISGHRVLLRANVGNYNPAIYSFMDIAPESQINAVVNHPFDCRESIAETTAKGPITDWSGNQKIAILPYSQVIYSLDTHSGELTPAINLITEHTIPEPTKGVGLEEYQSSVDKSALAKEVPISVIRSGQWLIIGFYLGSIVWNIDSKQGFRAMNGLDMNSISSFPFVIWDIIGSCGNNDFISCLDAEQFLNICSGITGQTKLRPNENIVKSVSADDNPILLWYHLKNTCGDAV